MMSPVPAAPAAPDPRPGAITRAPRRLVWFALGILSLLAARELTNRMAWPDALVAPLLLADTVGGADVIVVPGAGVTEACTPNLNSIRRVLLAVRVYRAGRAPLVLFSGGLPRSGGVHCAVADVMARLAEEVGLPSAVIRVERESQTTHQNAEMSAPILKALGAHRIVIVTDRLHMVRATAAYAHYGFETERASIPVFEGHRDNVSMLADSLRELMGITYYRWNGWIDDPWRSGRTLTQTAPTHAEPTGRQTAAHTTTPMSQPGAQPSAPRPIVLLGASYAGGWNVATLGSVPVVNLGVAGQQSFELLARFDADVVPHRPRAVIIWGFANDVFRAQRSGIDAALGRMRSSVQAMIGKARAHDIEPILATELTIRPPDTWKDSFQSWVGWALRKSSYQDYVNGHILEQDRWIRDTARQEGLLLLDLQPVVSGNDGWRRRAFALPDGSHVNGQGYDALTAYAEGVLRTRFIQP
jgi:uncharacterized SAM-binding protein YcdF (DUF218 family)/lysophospholipase L1-like esterase